MPQRTLELLEFPKVLELLAGYAVSGPGANACRALAPAPDAETAALNSRFMRQAMAWLGESGFRLSEFPSLDGLFVFIEQQHGPLDQDALFALKQAFVQARTALSLLPEASEGGSERFAELASRAAALRWPGKTWSGLNRCLNPEGNLKDESSPELLSARQEIRRIHRTCSRKVKDWVADRNIGHLLQDDYMTISSDRYVLPLRSNFKGRLPGIIHDYSQTGETCYFEPLFLVDLNNELQELKQEEREAERRVMLMLTDLLRSEIDSARDVYDLLVALDVVSAKARFADAIGARPLDVGKGPLCLRGARHPLLAFQGGVQASLLELKPEQRALIISGGNAGGKTVALKTLGLIVVMAHSGIPVPVEEGGSIPYYDKVFASMGDEQSLETHVSTFTAQIRRLSETWEVIDEGTLVLLDEFGAGTDPSQGAALAQAVVDEALEKGASLVAATHFPALKAYALSRDDVRAASVLFDPQSKRPLYQLGYDQVGASQALDAAREHGLPEGVLRRAEKYMLLESGDSTGVMDRLNALAVERERELRDLERERDKLRERRKALSERYERERAALLGEIKSQAQEIVRKWKSDRVSHKQAMKELSKARSALETEAETERPAPQAIASLDDLEKGMTVLYIPWKKNGVVEETDEKRGMVKLDLSGVGMWAKANDVAMANGAGKAPGAKSAPSASASGRSVELADEPATDDRRSGLSLDLRGRRSDVARNELERFLDKAMLDNYGEVEIIHGRGTGALRKEVHDFLRNFEAIHSFSLAPEDRGGDGMTVVELK